MPIIVHIIAQIQPISRSNLLFVLDKILLFMLFCCKILTNDKGNEKKYSNKE